MKQHRERGSVALMIGLSLPVVITMIALGTELTFLLFKQRQMQAAADASALGGATALQTGHPAYGVEAQGIAGYLGFVNGAADGTTVVARVPTSGPQQGNTSAVEVLISQPQTLVLVKVLYSGSFNVEARAVAIVGTGSYCALQLGASGNFTMTAGAVATLTSCGLAVDGSGSSALTVDDGAQLNAQSVSVVGTANTTNGTITPSSGLKTSQPTVADPYAAVALPTFSGCGGGNDKGYASGTWTVSPGVYCNGLTFQGGAVATLSAGVYFIDRGTFDVTGGAKVTGTNVTIVLTSSTGSNYANIEIDNGTTVTLSAPTSGATAGIVFYSDRRSAAGSVTSTIVGGASIDITGAIYLPTQTLDWNNGATNTSSTCTQLIAETISLTGANLQSNCPSGVSAIGGTNSSLVE